MCHSTVCLCNTEFALQSAHLTTLFVQDCQQSSHTHDAPQLKALYWVSEVQMNGVFIVPLLCHTVAFSLCLCLCACVTMAKAQQQWHTSSEIFYSYMCHECHITDWQLRQTLCNPAPLCNRPLERKVWSESGVKVWRRAERTLMAWLAGAGYSFRNIGELREDCAESLHCVTAGSRESWEKDDRRRRAGAQQGEKRVCLYWPR